MKKNKQVAFFDFDGTIYNGDSLIDFIYFAKGNIRATLGLIVLSPFSVLYIIKFISAQKLKEIWLTYFFKGMPYEKIKVLGNDFTEEIDKRIKASALKEIKWHQENGNDIYLVSASLDIWLKNWCSNKKIGLISSKLLIEHNMVTGKLKGKNCNGLEKSIQIKEAVDLKLYDEVFVYGDTNGDKSMIELGTKKYFKYFS
ncbi:MAG: HAD-IB family phosphatase [Ferruginibacter sp.]